ncbi:MAG: AMP-binding protein [Acidobacteriota bacterium]
MGPILAGMTLDFFKKLKENQQRDPDCVALQMLGEEGKDEFTFQRIVSEVVRISQYLRKSGIQSGDTVGILMENHPRWGIAFLAAQSAGARIVPFDILHPPESLAGLIRHSECTFLISSRSLLPKLEELQGLLPEPLPGLISGAEVPGWGNWETILAESVGTVDPAQLPLVARDLDDTLVVVYTSGTTGNPKGVMLSQRSIYRNVVEVLRAIDCSSKDHLLCVLPLYHVLALMANFIIPLYVGARVSYLDKLDTHQILNSFQQQGITIFVCVPQFYYLLHRRVFQEIEKRPLVTRFLFKRLLGASHFCNQHLRWNPGKLFFPAIHKSFGHLRFFAVGGARFDKEVAEALRDLGFEMVQAYGMTETSAVSTIVIPGVDPVDSVGHPLPHVEIRIDQPDEKGIGEVLIGGEHLMQGYWKNPRDTEETRVDGWLHSGDLGYVNSAGVLYITGRQKDVVVLSSGKNIFPEEVEHFYESRCRFIQEMCVLGVPDTGSSEQQEKLHAIIVPDFQYMRSQQVVNASDMIRYMLENISQQLPGYKRIRSFEIRRDPLPRTTTRKIKRFQLEKALSERQEGEKEQRYKEPTPPQTPIEEKIFEMIRMTGKTPFVNREMSLELDCGFDSLERVEFLSNVQDTFQIQIADEEATEIYTVVELVAVVEKAMGGKTSGRKDTPGVSWREILKAPLQPADQEQVTRVLRRRPFVELIYYLMSKALWILSKILLRLKIEGRENLPKEYPFIICPNHLSFLDGFVCNAALPLRTIRRLFFLGYSDYFSRGLMSFLGSLIKVIPVDSDRYLRQALRLGAHGLSENLILCVFPEGERAIDGRLKPFRKGPSILATELGVPVVPVGIQGTYEAWPRGSSRIRLRPVTVRFGPPLRPDGESPSAFNERLQVAVEALVCASRGS